MIYFFPLLRAFSSQEDAAMTTVARLVAMDNAEASRLGDSGHLRAHDSEENQVAVDGNWNATSFRAVMEDLPREYLFDKAVTPSDVGKLNRLVIPKQHAQKYFPLDGNSNEKGLLLDFEDSTGKVWRFRYAYWKSSQSYVLTKGWSRFVKDKKLKAGDIVSFQRASAQLYITRRHRLLAQPQLGIGPGSGPSKRRVLYPVKGSWSLDSFNSGTKATDVNKAQLMPIFWPSSSNPDAFTQFNFRSLSSHSKDAAWFNVGLLSAPSTEQMGQSRFLDIGSDGLQPMDLHLNLHNCLNSSERSINIKPPHPFVNPVQSFAGRDWETPEHKAASSLDPTTKKGLRLFGVTLA